MKKIWTLAMITALGMSTIGCETAETPPAAVNKPVPGAPPAEEEKKADEGEKKEGEEPKADAPAGEEPKKDEPKAGEEAPK